MNKAAKEALSSLGKAPEGWERVHEEKQAGFHRQMAVEIAQKLPADAARARAIMEDTIRLHSLIHDASASAVTRDFASKFGE